MWTSAKINVLPLLVTPPRFSVLSSVYVSYFINFAPLQAHHGDWFGGKAVGMAILNLAGLTANIYVTHVSPYKFSPRVCFQILFEYASSCGRVSVLITAACRVQPREGLLSVSQSGSGLGAAAVHPVVCLCFIACSLCLHRTVFTYLLHCYLHLLAFRLTLLEPVIQ